MELYHGSEMVIAAPQFGLGREDNDFGRGFYCTPVAELAMEWACKDGNRDAFVNKYHIPEKDLKVMDLTSGKYSLMNWMAILLRNRNLTARFGIARDAGRYLLDEFLPDCSWADIMIGYRADDSYFSIARAFLQNSISIERLGQALRLGNLGRQVVLKSEKAFSEIVFLGYHPVPYDEYFAKKVGRDAEARNSFATIARETPGDGLYMMDILRDKIRNDDPRLQ